MDACVLIDFCKSDQSVITLAVRNVGDVFVATPVLAEVEQLDASEAQSLGIKLVEPTLEMASQAATTRGPISFADRLCVLLAKERGWTCVSNDQRLRRACTDEDVSTLWGLELIALLVETHALPAKTAKSIGISIFKTNRFIGRTVLARFLRRIGLPES